MLRDLPRFILAGLSFTLVVLVVLHVRERYPGAGALSGQHPMSGQARLAAGPVWKSLEALTDGEHRLKVGHDDIDDLISCAPNPNVIVTVIGSSAQSREVVVGECRGWVAAAKVKP